MTDAVPLPPEPEAELVRTAIRENIGMVAVDGSTSAIAVTQITGLFEAMLYENAALRAAALAGTPPVSALQIIAPLMPYIHHDSGCHSLEGRADSDTCTCGLQKAHAVYVALLGTPPEEPEAKATRESYDMLGAFLVDAKREAVVDAYREAIDAIDPDVMDHPQTSVDVFRDTLSEFEEALLSDDTEPSVAGPPEAGPQ